MSLSKLLSSNANDLCDVLDVDSIESQSNKMT